MHDGSLGIAGICTYDHGSVTTGQNIWAVTKWRRNILYFIVKSTPFDLDEWIYKICSSHLQVHSFERTAKFKVLYVAGLRWVSGRRSCSHIWLWFCYRAIRRHVWAVTIWRQCSLLYCKKHRQWTVKATWNQIGKKLPLSHSPSLKKKKQNNVCTVGYTR